jgi:hypothetical protein
LYGSLDELRVMLVECLDAAASLAGRPGPGSDARHGSDPPTPVPDDVKSTVAYDIEATRRLLDAPWGEAEADLADLIPGAAGGLLRSGRDPSFMDDRLWYEVHGFLLDNFTFANPAWESLAFRLWLTRVLAYTTSQALSGFEAAMAYLESTIDDYERRSANDPSPPAPVPRH